MIDRRGPQHRAAGRAAATMALLVLLATPHGAGAQGETAPADATTNAAPVGDTVSPAAVAAIARDLNCPLCQGYNLEDCPLPLCAQMRDLIRERLAAGATRDEIVAAFVADYGPQVLNAPPATGFFLTAWILPVVVLVVGVLAAAVLLRRRPESVEDAPTDAPAYVEDVPTDAPAYVEHLERMVHGDDR